MGRYLVTFNRCWADEFDVTGFGIYTQQQAEELRTWASTERTVWFGTNEGWEDEILVDSYAFTELTDDEAAVLERLFPPWVCPTRGWFGYMPRVGDDNED